MLLPFALVCSLVLLSADKAFVKNLYDALAVDERRIWVDWEVGVQRHAEIEGRAKGRCVCGGKQTA